MCHVFLATRQHVINCRYTIISPYVVHGGILSLLFVYFLCMVTDFLAGVLPIGVKFCTAVPPDLGQVFSHFGEDSPRDGWVLGVNRAPYDGICLSSLQLFKISRWNFARWCTVPVHILAGDENLNVLKSKMADGRHFEKFKIVIGLPLQPFKILQWNCVHWRMAAQCSLLTAKIKIV